MIRVLLVDDQALVRPDSGRCWRAYPTSRWWARPREVVRPVAPGLSNDDIAARLVVSPRIAKTHVSRAVAKVGARDRAQLVVFAYQNGLVTPDGYDAGSTTR